MRPILPLSLGQQSRGEQRPTDQAVGCFWECGMLFPHSQRSNLDGSEPRPQRTLPTRGVAGELHRCHTSALAGFRNQAGAFLFCYQTRRVAPSRPTAYIELSLTPFRCGQPACAGQWRRRRGSSGSPCMQRRFLVRPADCQRKDLTPSLDELRSPPFAMVMRGRLPDCAGAEVSLAVVVRRGSVILSV